MRYFRMRLDKKFTHAPSVTQWFGRLDVRQIHPATSDRISERSLFEIRPDEALVFTDLLTYPYLLLSERMKEVVEAYEPLLSYKEVILLEKKTSQHRLYYLPILETLDCLHESSLLAPDRSDLRKIVLQKRQVEGRHLFRVGGVRSLCVVVSLALAESFLRRSFVGIGLEPALCAEREGLL